MLKYIADINRGIFRLKMIEADIPQVRHGLLIKVEHIFLEHIDYKYVTHGIYQRYKQTLPLTPGFMCVGTVVETLEKTELMLNKLVYCRLPYSMPGTYTEYLLLDKEHVYPVPEGLHAISFGSNLTFSMIASQLNRAIVRFSKCNGIILTKPKSVSSMFFQQYCTFHQIPYKTINLNKDNGDFEIDLKVKEYDLILDFGGEDDQLLALLSCMKSSTILTSFVNRIKIKQEVLNQQKRLFHFLLKDEQFEFTFQEAVNELLRHDYQTRQYQLIAFQDIPLAIKRKQETKGEHFVAVVESTQ